MVRHYVFICNVVDESRKDWDAGQWAKEINTALNGNFGLQGLPQHGFISVAKTEKESIVEVAFWMEESESTTIHDLIKTNDIAKIKDTLSNLGLEVTGEELRI